MRVAVAGGTGVVGGYAVTAAEAAGHDVVVLSRRRGVDVRTGAGLDPALEGVEVVIDTLKSPSLRAAPATAFATETSARLQQAGARAGVQHLVILSIVGIDRASGFGYYQAKLAHERAASNGPLPVTILRATQFHEFPAQVLAVSRKGPVAPMLMMRSQPVAARTVGRHLADIAGTRPGGTLELAGPEVHRMPGLARRLLAARGVRALVIPVPVPGSSGRAMRGDALLATERTTVDGPTFDEWLRSDDARVVLF